MKWKKVIALAGSFMLVCQSCSGAAVNADGIASLEAEFETEALSEYEMETEPISEMVEETETFTTEPETEIHAVPETEAVSEQTEEITDAETEGVTESRTESETEGTEAPGETESDKETEITEIPETEPETEAEKITEASTEAVTETETVSEKTETESTAESEVQTETQKESEMQTETEKPTETEVQSESETEISWGLELTMPDAFSYHQTSSYWDSSWYVDPDFRFTQVEKSVALVESERDQVNVYDTSSKAGNVVGILPYFSLVYILEEGQDWCYVESGDVRGFVENKDLKAGEYATGVVDFIGEYALAKGEALVSPYENHAFTYTHTTTKDVVADKQYGITIYSCDIKEYPTDTARAIGQASSGNLVFILEVDENGWYYVESGNVRGFVDPELIMTGDIASEFLNSTNAGESLVEELVKPSENENLYYTLKSVQVAGSGVGEDIAETAMSFVGKLGYVWGGTSLTSGADCSGFVQSVFASYGVNIPRLAEEQGANGMVVDSLSDAKPGDIVYYASGPHVGIYIGSGMVVQCSGDSYNTSLNPGKGPTVSFASYMPITSIRRYLIEEEVKTGESGNRLDLTSYTVDQMELIWAIVAQEDNGSYEGALAVISSAMNRCESDKWGYCGNNALSQLTAGGQYCYSLDTYWQSRLNGNVPDYVKQAVNDCLKKGIRNHEYTSFRSTRGKATGNDAVQIGGNWYFGV